MAERAISASDAAGIGKQTPRVYVPRIIHVDWATIHVLIGVASHVAWKILAKKYKVIRLRGKFSEHKSVISDLMKKWCWELVEGQIT
ncbi:hypothetical protein KEJ15_04060 [Candidatus Bathyarchaeota archaeon]|jgi:hypothetical protein|nr:hypothetical protein [Candidatus Bathyarchaeota archaeon]